MSYTTVLAIWPGERVEALAELRNSHESAPVVWDALCQRHLGLRPFTWPTADLSRLWALWRDKDVPLHRRAVLMLTFDRAYVTARDYVRMAADIKAFLLDFPVREGYVNHWPAIAGMLERPPACPAIGLHCTSVSENPFLGPWNDEREEYDPIDWATADDLYAALEAPDA